MNVIRSSNSGIERIALGDGWEGERFLLFPLLPGGRRRTLPMLQQHRTPLEVKRLAWAFHADRLRGALARCDLDLGGLDMSSGWREDRLPGATRRTEGPRKP